MVSIVQSSPLNKVCDLLNVTEKYSNLLKQPISGSNAVIL